MKKKNRRERGGRRDHAEKKKQADPTGRASAVGVSGGGLE
jgi:hypothetical protein